jgi:hypothetical protein
MKRNVVCCYERQNMTAFKVIGLVSSAALIVTGLSYALRLDKLMQKHDGFKRGFARWNTALGYLDIDRNHPQFPPSLNAELEALKTHQLAFLAALGIFAIIIVIGMISRWTS